MKLSIKLNINCDCMKILLEMSIDNLLFFAYVYAINNPLRTGADLKKKQQKLPK